MFGLGLPELLIVGIVAVMLFGKRLPEVARSLGQSYQQFRSGLRDIQTELDRATYAAREPLYDRQPAIAHQDESESVESDDAEANPTESDLDASTAEANGEAVGSSVASDSDPGTDPAVDPDQDRVRD